MPGFGPRAALVVAVVSIGACSPAEPNRAGVSDTVVLRAGQDGAPVASLDYFEDGQHQIDFARVRDLSSGPAVPWKARKDANFGYSQSRFWTRFSVRNVDSAERSWVLEHGYPLIQHVEVHIVADDGSEKSYRAGKLLPFADRPVQHRKFLFPFELAPGRSATIYVMLESTGTLRAPLRVLSGPGLASRSSNEAIALGIYFGVIVALVFYNLFIYLTIRDPSYLFYILYTAAFGLCQASLNGIAYQYLWPTAVEWNSICVPFLIGASFFCLGMFTRLFLASRALVPWLDKVLLLVCGASGFLAVLSVVHYGGLVNEMASMLVTYVPALILPVAGVCLVKGSRPARYYLVGFLVFFAGSSFVAAKDLGFAPLSFLTVYGMHLGSAVEALLFSLGLADRIRLLKDEKMRLEIEALQASRTLEESRKMLERQEAIGAVAAQVSHDIRSPLAALDVAVAQTADLPEDARLFIRSAVNRIRDIANNLLSVHRQAGEGGGEGGATSDRATVLLSALMDTVVTEKRMQYRSRMGIEIRFDLDADSYGLFVEVLPAELRRVASNLIDNAVEAIDASGEVAISFFRRKGFVGVRFKDTGRGMSPDLLERVGRRGETYGKTHGTGLGLHHATTQVEAWGGALEIASEVGRGTEISVLLPRADSPSWFAPAIDIPSGCQVVVLDDDISIHGIWAERLGRMLRGSERGQLLHVSTPGAFIEKCVSMAGMRLPRLFLVDYEFLGEERNGLDLIEELNIAGESILVTSRFEEVAVRERCQRLGLPLIPKGLAAIVPIVFQVSAERPSFEDRGSLSC